LKEPQGRWLPVGTAPVETWDLKTERFSVQTQWCAAESPVQPPPLRVTWGCQRLVRSGLPLCYKKKKEKETNNNNNKVEKSSSSSVERSSSRDRDSRVQREAKLKQQPQKVN